MTLYTSPWLTTREALDIAEREHPTNVVARCNYIRERAHEAKTVSEQACWLEALARWQLDEVFEPVASDPRPDPLTHPEYWTE